MIQTFITALLIGLLIAILKPSRPKKNVRRNSRLPGLNSYMENLNHNANRSHTTRK